MKKYHALIKNWKHVIRNNPKATVQFVIIDKDTSTEYLGLHKINLYQQLTLDEWSDFNVTHDNAFFISDEDLVSLVDYLLKGVF